ncbi:MAG: hypothetical protein KBS93_10930, partial [Flavobacteriaceae bacterium]|nr:hypothetical protein [Candidatus Onthonaster equi]
MRLQVLATAPTAIASDVGLTYWNSTDNKPYAWTGTAWLDLGSIYSHPDYAGTSQPAAALSGANVISKITLENGHVTGVTTRALTAANVGAAAASHTHAFGQITGLPTMTILGNNAGSAGVAQALTVGQLLTMLSIVKGTLAHLNTGTATADSTWSAKDLNDWLMGKLSSYLTAVNLAFGTRTATTLPITNSAGTGITLPVATATLAGLMSGTDKAKLDGIAAGANNYTHPTNSPGAHPFATTLTSGLQVLSQLVVNNEGHVTSISGRDLTAADIASVMIVAATNTTSTDATWSAATINSKLQAAINQAQTGALIYQGNYNPVTNTPDITTNTAVKIGWTYVVDGTGTFAGQAVEAGDMIIAKEDNPGTTAGKWQIVNKNIPAIVSATATVKGIIELATSTEAIAGTDTTRAIT